MTGSGLVLLSGEIFPRGVPRIPVFGARGSGLVQIEDRKPPSETKVSQKHSSEACLKWNRHWQRFEMSYFLFFFFRETAVTCRGVKHTTHKFSKSDLPRDTQTVRQRLTNHRTTFSYIDFSSAFSQITLDSSKYSPAPLSNKTSFCSLFDSALKDWID